MNDEDQSVSVAYHDQPVGIETGWKNPPTLSILKQDLTNATPIHDTQTAKIAEWERYRKGKTLTPKGEGQSKIQPKLIRKQAEWRYAALSEPFLSTPDIGTPSAGTLTNCTGLPYTGLADGTDGNLITWDADGHIAVVATGTAGQILTSNGAGAAPTFQNNAGGGASTALDNLASVAINTSLVSDTDSTDDLGSSSKYWANAYIDKLYLNATATIDGASAGNLQIVGNIIPATSDAVALGSTTKMFSDLFLASGAVVNFDNGDLTLTHSSNLLKIAGGNLEINDTNINIGSAVGDKASIKLNSSALNDESWSGTIVSGTAGAALAVGDVCFLNSSGKWVLNDGILDGTDTGFKSEIGICVLAASGDTEPVNILVNGLIASAAFPAFTVGAPVYLDDTAGDLVVAQPSTTNFAIRIVGYALSATVLHFNPSPDYIVHI